MVEITTVTAAIKSLKVANEILTTVTSIDDKIKRGEEITKLYDVIAELQGGLLSIQSDFSKVLLEKEELEKRLAQKEDWKKVKDAYVLSLIGDNIFAYKSKDEPKHLICPNCFREEKKSILQKALVAATPGAPLSFSVFLCPACKTKLVGNGDLKL